MCIIEKMLKISVFKQIKKRTLESLAICAVVKKYDRNEHLFLERENNENIFFIINGATSSYKICTNEEKKVIFIHKTGEMINEEMLDGSSASVSCEFLKKSTLLIIKRKDFLNSCKNDFDLSNAVMGLMSIKIRRMYRQMKNTINSMRGDKKIAAKLWKLAKDHGKQSSAGVEIDFPLTITYLADLIGSKRESVSRQVKILVQEGLIINNDRRITVVNMKRLLKYIQDS